MQFALLSLSTAAEIPLPEGARLRDIAGKSFDGQKVFIGGTTGWGKLERGSGVVLDREFSYVTPENDFKQGHINPRPGVWKWKNSDAWIKRTKERGQVLRIHGPISPQCSKWVQHDSRTKEELEKTLDEFMTKLCQRYNKAECVRWMDVVNETVTVKGEWFGPKPGVDKWENPWPKMGFDESHELRPPLYIKKAFEIANKHAPNIELIINQHGTMDPRIWDKIKGLVKYLREQGLRVDGIGWQAHVNLGWEKEPRNIQRLEALIDWAHANQLSFHITENNVWMRDEVNYEAQATTFGAILSSVLKKRHSGEVSWNVWNLSDADQWAEMKRFKGCIFFDDFAPKPAYYALQKVLSDIEK